MPKITPSDKTPAVRITVWLLVVITFVSCVIRFTAKAQRATVSIKKMTLDDWLIVAAFVRDAAFQSL